MPKCSMHFSATSHRHPGDNRPTAQLCSATHWLPTAREKCAHLAASIPAESTVLMITARRALIFPGPCGQRSAAAVAAAVAFSEACKGTLNQCIHYCSLLLFPSLTLRPLPAPFIHSAVKSSLFPFLSLSFSSLSNSRALALSLCNLCVRASICLSVFGCSVLF